MKKTTSFLAFLLIAIIALGQGYNNKRKFDGPFPGEHDHNFKPKGWFIAPGATYMLPQKSLIVNDGTQTGDPAGKFGLYGQVGRYRLLRYWYLFDMFDYGIAYKGLRGKDKSTDVHFGDHFISAHADFTNVINLSNYHYIGNAIGANIDYGIIRNVQADAPPSFIGQLHYKFSFGWKATETLMIIPSLETPIFNVYPFEPPKSTLRYNGNRHRPLLFSVKFLFFNRDKEKNCPPVYNPMSPEGIDPDGKY